MFKKDIFLSSLVITSMGMFTAFGIYYVLVCLLSEEVTLLPAWIIIFMFVGLTLFTAATWSKQ